MSQVPQMSQTWSSFPTASPIRASPPPAAWPWRWARCLQQTRRPVVRLERRRSSRTAPTGEGELHPQQAGKVTLATIDLSREDHDSYYLGYSNDVLWPVFHYRLDLANFDAGFIGGYRRVNQLFARKLLPLLQPDDIIWVHDYHLIPLAAELRAHGLQAAHRLLPAHPAAAADHPGGDPAARLADALAVRLRPDRLPEPSRTCSTSSSYVRNEAHGEALGDDRFRAYGQHGALRRLPDRHRRRRVRRAHARARNRATCTRP